MQSREVITRRHLPHWYVPGAVHFITYRLAGTIPDAVLETLRHQKATLLRQDAPEGRSPAQHREDVHKRFFAECDRYLDRVCKVDWLAQPPIAALVRQNLYYHNGGKYGLLAYSVMPNHVHLLVQPTSAEARKRSPEDQEGDERQDSRSPLADIMHSLKSYTANKANELLGRSGQFWQHESYDHWVRDEDELERIINYIAWNPVKAKLAREPHEWFFCSAHDRFLQDGCRSGLLSCPSEDS
jgi:putative DNA methylase